MFVKVVSVTGRYVCMSIETKDSHGLEGSAQIPGRDSIQFNLLLSIVVRVKCKVTFKIFQDFYLISFLEVNLV